MNENLYLAEAMKHYKKRFSRNTFNILNAPAGSGKTHFIFNEFLKDTPTYVQGTKKNYNDYLGTILYVCDTTMLKDSILNDNADITKKLEKNDLKKNMTLDDRENKIKVITYSTLGFLLNNEASRYIILNYFSCIIFDEIHNLFKYAFRFKDEKNGNYYTKILNDLPTLTRNILMIGITATPFTMYYPLSKLNTSYTTIFTMRELTGIKHYKNNNEHICKYMINEVKRLGINYKHMKEHNYKVLIYTNTKSVAEKYKQILIDSGYNAEYLCSLNNSMTDKQIQLRQFIINNNCYPVDLDILIINGAYETGWNLKDNNIQYVLIDSIKYDVQIQARNRVRNDITLFIHKDIIDEYGTVYEYDMYKNLYIVDNEISVEPILCKNIEKEYINKKLTKEDKQYLVYKYGVIHNDEVKESWASLKDDINKYSGQKVITGNKGTYIINKADNLKDVISNNKRCNKMNNDNELNNYLESIINVGLNKQQQNELINNIGLKDARGRLQKSIGQLNVYLIENYNKSILSKRIKDNQKLKTIWIISNLE